MKLSLGMRLQPGAWGGGNQFGYALTDYLQQKNVEVSFDLKDPDLDIILLVEPDSRLKISAYSHHDILKYLLFRNRRCIVVHRLNNSSEAKNDETKVFNKYRIAAGQVADHTVFISQWLYARYVESGFNSDHYSVILNGGNRYFWRNMEPAGRTNKLRFVTHHWSNHPNKGFDIYDRLDKLLQSLPWSQQIDFTYIGRLPDDFYFQAAKYLEPLSGQELVKELHQHHVYLTASQYEAAGMHHIEGALCGLPLLYRESGGIPEYCQGFGIPFAAKNFEQKLREMIESYNYWADQMKDYPHTAERMSENYYNLFVELLEQRDEIIKRRSWERKPVWLMKTLISR